MLLKQLQPQGGADAAAKLIASAEQNVPFDVPFNSSTGVTATLKLPVNVTVAAPVMGNPTTSLVLFVGGRTSANLVVALTPVSMTGSVTMQAVPGRMFNCSMRQPTTAAGITRSTPLTHGQAGRRVYYRYGSKPAATLAWCKHVHGGQR